MCTGNNREQERQLEQDDEWLDEALRESFPASDPVPVRHKERDRFKERSSPTDV